MSVRDALVKALERFADGDEHGRAFAIRAMRDAVRLADRALDFAAPLRLVRGGA